MERIIFSRVSRLACLCSALLMMLSVRGGQLFEEFTVALGYHVGWLHGVVE